jgi:hypothetical protein
MLVTVPFTVPAQAAALPALGGVFLGFIALIGLNATLGLFDSFSRGQADMTYNFVPGAKRLRQSHLYAGFLWGVIIFGICILLWGPADGPAAVLDVLDVLAFLSTFAMGAYCIVLLLVNNRLLPKPIRPKLWTNLIIGFGAFFYLGMLIYSLVRFGVVVG